MTNIQVRYIIRVNGFGAREDIVAKSIHFRVINVYMEFKGGTDEITWG